MTINPQYMIAPSVQEFFINKNTGLPLSGGIVTFYKDQARSVLKPIFTLGGSPPNYNYVELSNPLVLSGIGCHSNSSEKSQTFPARRAT